MAEQGSTVPLSGYLEVWGGRSHRLVPLDTDRLSIGRAGSSAISLADETVSRLHAVVERYAGGWAIRDLGSVNGTFVNGRRVSGERRLQPGDEIAVGGVRLFFRSYDTEVAAATAGTDEPPVMTPREREVLLALCRPLFDAQPFPQPMTVKELAQTLVVTEAAIKQHLLHLYDKFGIHAAGNSRRIRLANEAIRRRAVTTAELRKPTA